MLEINPLSEENFTDFISLLLERGETPETYYRWKYLQQIHTFFPTGFVAYWNAKPVGCIGNINQIYSDAVGNQHHATWFADWFVLNEVRGKGIGGMLMQKVISLSPYAFGIPGPKVAQLTAEKIGYKLQNNFYEIQLPCKPFAYGFKQYNSGFFRNLVRGIKQYLLSGFISSPKSVAIDELKSVFNCDFENQNNSFHVTTAYLNWLFTMPSKVGNSREWFKVSNGKSWSILVTENDSQLVKRARLVCVFVPKSDEYIFFLKQIRKQLNIKGICYLQAYFYSEKKPNIASQYIKSIPQTSSFNILDFFTISYAIMESRWQDLKMKQQHL